MNALANWRRNPLLRSWKTWNEDEFQAAVISMLLLAFSLKFAGE
jgi:hypothetical protein